MVALGHKSHGGDRVGSDSPRSDQDVLWPNGFCSFSGLDLCNVLAKRNESMDLSVSLLLVGIEDVICCCGLV